MKKRLRKKLNKKANEVDKLNINSNVEDNNEVNLEEYKPKELGYITINNNKWFNNKKNIIIDNEKLVVSNYEKPIYISYLEDNCNFSILPDNQILDVNNDSIYTFDFSAVGKNSENVKLYIISYGKDSKLYMETLKANSTKRVKFASVVKNIRLAVKFEGECHINLLESFINIIQKKN